MQLVTACARHRWEQSQHAPPPLEMPITATSCAGTRLSLPFKDAHLQAFIPRDVSEHPSLWRMGRQENLYTPAEAGSQYFIRRSPCALLRASEKALGKHGNSSWGKASTGTSCGIIGLVLDA